MNFDDFLRWEETSYDAINVKRIYVDIAGDLIAGVLLSQIVYWHLPSKQGESKLRVMKDGHLWLAKGREDWWDECRITPKQFDRAITLLVSKGVVVKRLFRFGGSPMIHIRLVPEALMDCIEELLKSGEHGKMDFDQRVKSNSTKGKNPIRPKGKNITETTTEITYKERSRDIPQAESATPSMALEEIIESHARYSDGDRKVIADYWDTVRWTRKTGTISPNIVAKEMEYWERFDVPIAIQALKLHIERYQSKPEGYTRGIMRGLKRDTEMPQRRNAPEPTRRARPADETLAELEADRRKRAELLGRR